MAYRKRAGRASRRKFSRTARRVHPRNVSRGVMRGGIRL